MSTHDEMKANVAGFVLGSLDAHERQVFESHLAQCAECRTEVASLRPIVGVLADAVPQVTPRPEVRNRVLGIAAVPGLTTSAEHVVVRGSLPQRRKSRPSRSTLWLSIAAAIVIAIGAAIYAVRVQRQLGELQARFDQAQTAAAVLTAPDLARIDLQGQPSAPDARARALWSRSRGLVFTAANLPPAPAGKVYQVWVVTAQRPISAGLFTTDPAGGSTQYYYTPSDIAAPVAVAVTLEPAGGVAAPTGEKYLVGMP
jgi:anti-sigma-K factor RskA